VRGNNSIIACFRAGFTAPYRDNGSKKITSRISSTGDVNRSENVENENGWRKESERKLNGQAWQRWWHISGIKQQ